MEVIIDGLKYVPQPEAPPAGGTHADALNVRMPESDAGDNITVRDYLFHLLYTLWREGEGFSGKRPFGNSGWAYELYHPLLRSGFIDGKLDAYGDIERVTEPGASAYVKELIKYAFYGEQK